MKVASVQIDPSLGDLPRNRDAIIAGIRKADAELVVFPECALSGYGFESKEEGLKAAESVLGPSTEAILGACRETGRWAVYGMLEAGGEQLFNSAVLVGPGGIAGTYRKVHLPFLGVDRFVTPGDVGFSVFETDIGRIGVLICYDGSFPESARALKLGGAQLIALPTNWPEAAEVSCLYSPMVRAQENHVNFMSCNRVGEEAGFTFRGGSKICDYDGKILAEADRAESIITAEIDLAAADRNRVIYVAGRYELDRIGDRRPETYERLSGK